MKHHEKKHKISITKQEQSKNMHVNARDINKTNMKVARKCTTMTGQCKTNAGKGRKRQEQCMKKHEQT